MRRRRINKVESAYIEKLSKLVNDLAKGQYEKYTNYRRSNYQLHLDNGKIILKLDVIA